MAIAMMVSEIVLSNRAPKNVCGRWFSTLNMHIFSRMFTKSYYMYCSTFFLHVLDPVDRNDAMDMLGLNVTMSIVNVGAHAGLSWHWKDITSRPRYGEGSC